MCATGPPLKPNQRTAARKTPSPASPSPMSSGWWCAARARGFFAVRRLFTRLGVFGDVLWGRFLRAMRRTSPRVPPLLLPVRGKRCGEHPVVGRRFVREELGAEDVADRAVQHQELPEAVRLRGDCE